jgi:chaperonin GroEL
MGNIVVKSFDARRAMLEGMRIAVGVVIDTFGPRGKVFAYNNGTNTILSKDGITALKKIKLSNELKDMGVKFVTEASDKANYHNGDGSSTTAILTYAMCEAMNKLINQGFDINLIRSCITEIRDFIFSLLTNFKCDVDDEKQIHDIAFISANGDEEMADLITQAFTSIGDKGLVSYADSQSRYGESSLVLSKGCEIGKGYISSKCVNSANDQAIFEDVYVAIFRDVIEDLEHFKMFIQLMHGHNLLVIAPDYSDEVAAFYTNTAAKDNNVFIRTPGYSRESIQRENEDLAVIFNTQIIGEDIQLEEMTYDKCGHAESIIATKNNVVVTEPSTDKNRKKEYVDTLQGLIDHQDPTHALSSDEITNIKSRIAKLDGGIATIYVGALSNQELSERKDRVDDALNAVRNALNGGFVVGGGTTLYRIAEGDEYAELLKNTTSDKKVVYDALMQAIKMPLKILVHSASCSYEKVAIELYEDKNFGFNARTGKVENLIEQGIVDPFNIVKNAVLYSTNMTVQFVSIADAIISDVKNLTIEPLDEVVDPGRSVFSELM